MYYELITDLVKWVKLYEEEVSGSQQDVHSFIQWINGRVGIPARETLPEPEWEGKVNGRSADSVINTSLVHLYRYAKLQASAAIEGTAFSTPDEFIYLISLMVHGSMSKTALIKLNIQVKSAGMQIVKRLMDKGLVEQTSTSEDKRNRMLHITDKGIRLLNENMGNIRQASRNVTEPLTNEEKMDLIRILIKLEKFHELKAMEEK